MIRLLTARSLARLAVAAILFGGSLMLAVPVSAAAAYSEWFKFGPELEKQVLDLWRRENVFGRIMAEGAARPKFVFYEGPPTANGTITRTPAQDQTPVTYSTPAATASLASGD